MALVRPESLLTPLVHPANMSVLTAEPILASAIAPVVARATLDVWNLPPGFPSQLETELAWTGSSVSKESGFILQLSDAETAEVKTALEHFKS